MRPVQLAPEPAAVRVLVAPRSAPGSYTVTVESPGADSVALASENGLDRWWSAGPRLIAAVTSDVGDTVQTSRFAVRERGVLLNTLKKPVRISSCRERSCREFYHELALTLPERNLRQVAVSFGYGMEAGRFTRDGAGGSAGRGQAAGVDAWEAQGEVAWDGLSARFEAYHRSHGSGGSLDLSRALTHGSGRRYGAALNLSLNRDRELAGLTGLPSSTSLQVSIGPSLMLRGLAASTQIGLSTDGHQLLQVLSTRIFLNGHLTTVRMPLSMQLEKSYAFGGGDLFSRRNDAVTRMILGIEVISNTALRLGLDSRSSSWPTSVPYHDLHTTAFSYSVGAAYTLSW